MDILNNKAYLQSLRQFTLKATASAILTLNAEAVIADTCPINIIDAALASIICEFNGTPSPPGGNSVTVGSTGIVGGISMLNYNPTDSFITINPGGAISNSSGSAIALANSSLSNGLYNNGTISATSGIGISLFSSTVQGGISNSGMIITTTGTGISLSSSTVQGGISNSGSIDSDIVAISLSSSDIDGGINNSGLINGIAGIGIVSRTSTIQGGIINSGSITIYNTAITISQSAISGGIFNSGTIHSNYHGTGIKISNSSSVNGSIFNSGTIIGSLNDSGITISNKTTIQGDITNGGLIQAIDGNAIAINGGIDSSYDSHIIGGIFNSGRIESSSGNGIDNNTSIIHENIFNSGVISGQVGIDVHNSQSFGITTGNGNIFNSGAITGAQTGILIHSMTTVYGGISNSGVITGGHAGIFVDYTTTNGNISNSGLITGGVTGIVVDTGNLMTGSITNSGTIQGGFNAINISDNNVNSIDIHGQNARIIGKVNALGTDVYITNGASFSSEGSYHVNNFNIIENALFTMNNNVHVENAFTNSGILAINNASQIIQGNYTQNLGGVFKTGVTNATTYGQLVVSDAVDLLQSGTIDVQLNQDTLLHEGDILFDVIQGSTLTSPTQGFNVTDNSFIWTFNAGLNAANNGVNLITAINPLAYTVCQGTYCQGAANIILEQVATGNPKFSEYAQLPNASAFKTAASQATPELTNENIQMMQLITRAVVDIVPMWSSLRGSSSGDATLYPPGKIWLKPYGASMTQNERNTVNGFNAAAYGAVIGKDIELDNHWLLGGAFAAGGDDMHGKSVLSGQSIYSNAYQGMIYGAKKFQSQIYVAGQGLVGYEINHTNRFIPLYATTAKGTYNNWFTNIRAESGWSTYAFNRNFVLTPEIDASYLFINQGSFQEFGSPMDLSVATQNNSSLVIGAYANGAYHITTSKQHELTISGYGGIAGDVINSQPQAISTFVAGGSSFKTFGVQFNGLVFRGGAGLIITHPTKPIIVELNYDLQTGNNAYSGIGSATFKYKL